MPEFTNLSQKTTAFTCVLALAKLKKMNITQNFFVVMHRAMIFAIPNNICALEGVAMAIHASIHQF